MRLTRKHWSLNALIAAGLVSSVAAADASLPAGAKSLKEIVTALEKSGYQIVEASIDDGHWEIDAYRENVSYDLDVDTKTGQVLSEHRDDADPVPPAGALPLSNILEAVEKAEFTSVSEADFEHGRWEIEAYRNKAKRELRVDPSNGKILEDRADD